MTHEVPRAARKAFEKAERAKAAGKKADAIAAYQKAIAIDPEYLEAWNNLGSVYSRTEEIAKAEHAFRRAYEIEPRAAVAANLAFVELRKGNPEIAESLAREALRGDPLTANPRYLLAIALAAQNKQLPEAVRLLEDVCGKIPQAHLTLAPLLAHLERRPEAAGHLKTYLAMGGTADRKIAKQLLQEIEASLGKP